MLSMKLLLSFMVLTGIVAEECSYGDLGIQDFSDQVIITNASDVADAFVTIKFNHGQVTAYVPAGRSRMAYALAATKYTAMVTEPISREHGFYKDRLLILRDGLVAMTLAPGSASPDEVADAWTELSQVQATLEQLEASGIQSCSAKLQTDVNGQVTVKRAETSDGGALWVLDCG